jgi:hypothetical protein
MAISLISLIKLVVSNKGFVAHFDTDSASGSEAQIGVPFTGIQGAMRMGPLIFTTP